MQSYSTSAGGRDGVSKGIELYAQHTFSSGFGFQANYTYNKTNQAAITLADGRALRRTTSGLGTGAAEPFALRRTSGCTAFPEVETNVEGRPFGGAT